MKRILIIFGTRPEAIKLAPVILELKNNQCNLESVVCVTAQHRQMLDQVLNWFKIEPNFDLDLMVPNQTLNAFCSISLAQVSHVIEEVKPDLVMVQGDTTTVMAAALAAFYLKVPVAHIEAGLRTGQIHNPFPEEINRRITSLLTTFHFAPTKRAAAALQAEKVPESNIFITGNTVVDALKITVERKLDLNLNIDLDHHRMILVTAHRRESFGAPFESLCLAIRDLVEQVEDIAIVYPVHLNPNVQAPVKKILSNVPRVHLIEPLPYEQFCHLMAKSCLILTDSGGIQEEAPVLGKPTLVMRATTERMEAVEFGTARMVGTDRTRIVAETKKLLTDNQEYHRMANAGSPFGDGLAAKRIVSILSDRLN